MEKIYYNKDGWVCERYPYDLPITDDTRYIEVADDLADATYSCPIHYSWRVINGKLEMQQYEDIPQREIAQAEIEQLKQQLADMDYKTSKYVDGEYTEAEWQAIVDERKAIRERIRELEEIINLVEA